MGLPLAAVLAGLICVFAWTGVAGGTQPYETYEDTVAGDGPVALFRFNDSVGSSTIADSVGSYTATNSGIVLGGEGPFPGSKSGSLGGEAFATLPADPLAGASAFTAEAWVDWAGATLYKQPIFDFGSSSTSYMYLTPASALSKHTMLFEIRNSAGTVFQVTAPKLTAKAWEYVAVSETSAGTLTLYVDGEQVGQTTGATLSPASLGSTPDDYLGRPQASGEPMFDGSMSNVAFYTKALSASQILAHYHAGEFPVNTALPTISGTAKDGKALTAKAGTWFGLTPITFAYQWTHCNVSGGECKEIPSATETKYTLGHENVGQTLRVVVTASNSAGGGTATSAQTAIVEAIKPSNSALPVISGSAKVGQVLPVSNGSWEGSPPTRYEYQWELCNSSGAKCKTIPGATEPSYEVISSQVGDTLRAIVTAVNSAGSASATSEPTPVITPGPPRNKVLPAISGTARDGEELTASSGSWAGTEPIEYTYRWQGCNSSGEGCSNIPGATGTTYTLGPSNVGSTLDVVVTAKNSVGPTNATSHVTAVVAAKPPANTVAPSVTGIAKDGETLSASTGSWAGTPPLTYGYRWQRCNSAGESCSAIPQAAEADYTATHEDVGTTLRVEVTATNAGGSVPASSAATATVAALAPSDTAKPTISGEAKDAQTLTAGNGEWAGTPPISYAYQWQRCSSKGEDCTNLSGATSAAHVAGHEDVGATLRVVVTATNSAGSASAASEASAVVAALAPSNTVAPSIAGEAKDGQTLTASVGEWVGTPTISYSYQWESCGSLGEGCLPVAGATGASYPLTDRDVGTTVRVFVTATNSAGTASAASAATSAVSAIAPANTQLPAITGAAVQGATLTASTGTWSGSEPISYSYQWLRCNSAGSGCESISGAHSPSYQPVSGDVGHTLGVTVTAENTAGSASATSPASTTVAGSECDVWTGDADDGLWQTPGNWSTGATPSGEDEACIPAGATASITGGSQQVGSIVGEGGLAISGGSIELADSSQRSSLGSLSLSNGALTGSGTLELAGSFTLGSDGAMTGSGSIVIEPGATGLIEAESGCEPMTLAGRSLVNEGTLDYVWGTLMMSDGATLQNTGTLEYDTGSVCYEPQIQEAEESSSPAAIFNTGTFERIEEGTGGIGVNFNNDGTVEAQRGRLELSDGGVPEEVATGSWNVQDGGSIALTGGTFEIGEEVDLSDVEVAGATIERTSMSGPRGYLSPRPYASHMVTISGHGHDLASASIELAPTGTSEWQPLCGPLTPNLAGEYECEWNTASGSYPDGSYQLRAQLSDGSTPPNTVLTAAITVLVDNTPPAGSVSAPTQLEGDQTVAGTASDTGSGVASWQLQIAPEGSSEWTDACPAQESPVSANVYECTVETISYPSGSYQLRAVITDKAGNTYSTSPASTTIENEPPSNTAPPRISGTAEKGQSLVAGTGSWSGAQPLTYSYQWQTCDGAGANCSNIPGATGATYRVVASDLGSTLRVLVTARNSLGSASAPSEATEVVAGASCTEVWTGEAGGGSWSTPGNWSTGQVPGASSLACIDEGVSVEISAGSNAVGQLEDEGSLVLSGGSLELADGAQLSSVESLTVRNATLTGAGSLLVSGSFSLGANGTMSGSGATVLGPGVSGEIYGSSGCEPMSFSERKLINEGTLAFSWGTLIMSDGAQLENEGTFQDNTEASCDGPQIQSSGPTEPSILNTGVFEKTTGRGTSTVAVAFTNQGAVEAQTGTLDFSGGAIPEETAYGSWAAQSGASLVFSGGTFWISEAVDLSAVRNDGATVELVASTGPPVLLTAPVISGEASVGQALSASSGQWKGARPLSYAYQWERCDISAGDCAEIPGATSSTYLLASEDDDSTLRVIVTATNGQGSASSTSKATATVTFPPENTSLPTISGSARTGQTLSASAGSWEGSPPISYSYQWQRCTEGGGGADVLGRGLAAPLDAPDSRCVNIEGADAATYTVRDSDVEATLRVIVSAENAAGEASAVSEQSEVVAPGGPPENTAPPSVLGTAQEGQTLEASTGSWQSPGSTSYAVQWERCNASGEECASVEGATGPTYVPSLSDLGATLRVTVTATNPVGSESATSEQTAAVTQAPPPLSSEAPRIAGIPKDGQTLTAGTGSWQTPFPLTYSYQWQRCGGAGEETCSDIAGATSSSYTLSSADPADSALRVIVTATNPYQVSASSASSARFIPRTVRVTEYAYDANGNLVSRTDGDGHTTTYSYGPGNEPTKLIEADGATSETGYDADGRVTSQTDGNKHATKYTRNVLGEVTEVTDPLGRRTTKEYDPAGNLTSVTDPEGRTTRYSYDTANRLAEISYSDGKTPAVKYEYDADGDRTKMTDGTGTSTYGYNQLDQLTETTDGHGDTTGYEYNLAGQQTKITYPGNKPVERSYDQNGRLSSIKDWLGNSTNFAYDPESNLTAITFPESTGETDHYAYNDASEMSETSFEEGSETLASLAYARDSEGQVAQTTTKGLPGEETTEYAYDQDDRLSKAGSAAYEYDAAGNPTNTDGSANAYDAADQLEHSTGASYTYNQVGERTKTTPSTGPATSYGYDQAGNLTSVSRPEEDATPKIEDSYTYNGEGLRSSETSSGTTTQWTWDVAEPLPLLLSNDTNSYIYGPSGLPVEQINNSTGTVQYLHHDQAGSTRLITGSTGKTEATFTYGPYGETTGSTGTATTPLGYDAQYTSADTGLIYLRNRVYDPATAQFLTVDPAVSVTREPYAYGGDNPVNRRDPDGLSAEGIEGVPCYWPLCGPPPPAVEGVQHGVEHIEHGLESAWNFITEKEGPNDEGEAALHEKEKQRECGEPNPGNLEKVSDREIKRILGEEGTDPHTDKAETLGGEAGGYDYYRDKTTGEIYLAPKGGGEPIPTGLGG